MFEQQSLAVGDQHIFYQVGGSGQPVVLLHGLSGSGLWWARNIRPLAEQFRVYVVDLLGFGRSRGQRFMLDQAAGLLVSWMDLLGKERFHLVGHSMGGLVSAELAATHPERVDRLVLVDAAVLPLRRSLFNSMLRLAPALYRMPVDFWPTLLTDALRAGPLTLLQATLALHRADITVQLERLAARTLIVWGEYDHLLPEKGGRLLHESLPGSAYVVVRGAGHNPMWDRAAMFNRLVIDFLGAESELNWQPENQKALQGK